MHRNKKCDSSTLKDPYSERMTLGKNTDIPYTVLSKPACLVASYKAAFHLHSGIFWAFGI